MKKKTKKTKKMKKLGLIGCGHRLKGVIEKLLSVSDEIEVTALADPSPESIRTAKRRVAPNATVYKDYRELVKDKDLDWVAVGSWNSLHKEHIIAALRAGKDVFTEKPMAIDAAECLAIKRAVEKSGKKVIVGFTLRYSPHYRKIKELVDKGTIGKVISFEFNETLGYNHGGFIHSHWRRWQKFSGTHMLEKCCHDLDIANWIVDSVPVKAASFGGLDFFVPKNKKHMRRLGKNKDGVQAYRIWARKTVSNPFTAKKDIIDNQVAILEYHNGVRATFHTNCNAAVPERRMYILGEEGAIRSEAYTGLLETQRIGFDTEIVNEATGVKGGHAGGDEYLAECLKESIVNDAPSVTPFEDGMTATITANAIDQAMEKSKVVDLTATWKRVGVRLA
jgi:predicted dehydrogenase